MNRNYSKLILIGLLSYGLLACTNGTGDTTGEGSPDLHTKPAIQSAHLKRPHLTSENGAMMGPSDDASLATRGIPTTKMAEIFRAMPDSELRTRAQAGDVTAKTFWVERLSLQVQALQRGRTDGRLPGDIPEGEMLADLGEIGIHISPLIRDPNNAMASYLYGQQISASTYGSPLEPIVAGIRLAGDRGDPRAPEFERQFMAEHPGLDQDRIDMYYEYGRQRFNPPPKP